MIRIPTRLTYPVPPVVSAVEPFVSSVDKLYLKLPTRKAPVLPKLLVSRENLLALLLCLIIILLVIVTTHTSPQWIYQGF